MKPNFILELSHTGIRLRQLKQGKSQVVGDVSLDDAEFDSKVAELRNGVAEKSDAPMATELRIPNSEILFTTIDDPEFDAKTAKISRDKAREKAVRDALEGMTPYALPDLNFVWKIKGEAEISVAAVAHETLAEAEEFAASRGFNPVRFAARPGKSKYPGTAQFGSTALQRRRAASEAEEARQAEAEKAARAAAPPPPAPKVETPPAKTAPKVAPDTANGPPAPEKTAAPKPAVDSPKPDDRAAADRPTPASTAQGTPEGRPDATTRSAPSAAAAQGPGDLSPAPPARRLSIDKIAPLPASAQKAPDARLEPQKPAAPAKSGAETPRVGFSQPRINDPQPPLEDDGILDDVPPMPVSFASRRKQQPPAPGGAKATAPSPTSALSPGAATDPSDGESRFGRIAARFAVTPENTGTPKGTVPPPPPRRAGAPALRGSADKPTAGKPGTARAKPVVGLPDTAEAAASLAPITDADGKMLTTGDRALTSSRMAKGGKLGEAEAMTVFGARAAADQRSFMPLLIGIVIAALLAAGVWATFLLTGDNQISGGDTVLPEGANAVLAPAPVDPDPAPEQAAAAPEPAPETPDALPEAVPPAAPGPSAGTDVADLPDGGGPAPPGDEPSARASAPDSTVAVLDPQAPVPPTPEALPITPSAPFPISRDPLQRPGPEGATDNTLGRYATTGIWVDPPVPPAAPVTDRVDDLYVASADPTIDLDAGPPVSRLPELAAPQPLAPQLPPAPQGDGFELDERGLVTATPDGTLSPDGILITAGPPARTPPQTPDRPATLTPDAAGQPDLPRTRPRARPGDDDEQTQLDTAAVAPTQEAGLQPRPRPTDVAQDPADTVAETIQDRARLAALEATGASTATPQAPLATPVPRAPPADLIALRNAEPEPEAEAEAEAEPETTAQEPISPYAVARSRLPKTKPRNFAQNVASARARAAAAPQEQVVTRVAAPAAVTTPRIPSRASVAKQATVKNAINLGKVNLIGVYGSASNRRALVRLPTGKFVKVKVGDRVDGGRVAAIGQSQLSYTKGGRRVTLDMPSG